MMTTLVEFAIDHVDLYIDWLSSDELRKYRGEPPTRGDVLEQLACGDLTPDQTSGTFIVLDDGDHPIGWVRYFQPDPLFDAFELTVILANQHDRGRGAGPIALTMLIDYLFENFSTRRIQARVLEDNPRAQKLCRELGFVREGVMRAAYRMGETWQDVLLFSILKEEWRAELESGSV